MYTVTREIPFAYGHRLLGYEGKCARIHGHNGRLVVTLGAERLDATGMVVDFVKIKEAMRLWIEETIDHRLILHRDDPAVGPLRSIGEPLYVVDFNPTAENIARHVYEHLRAIDLPVVRVAVEETDQNAAAYEPETD